MADQRFDFDKFSRNAFYGALNARLVDMVEVGSSRRIVDLACGTGGVTRLILERLRGARDSVVIAIDHSATALKQAMEELRDAKDSAIQFVQSQVEQVSDAVKDSVDTIFFCNAIHYIPDKSDLLHEVFKSLKPGGQFAFNTSFYEGSHLPETLSFYRRWMLKAARILRREYGLSPDRDTSKVESRKQLTPGQYRGLLEDNGFTVVRQEIDTVEVPIDGWLDISGFEDFINGVMPGVPLEVASASLKEGVRLTFEEMELEAVPRNWLDVVAVRS